MKRLSIFVALAALMAANLACTVPLAAMRTIEGSGNVVTEEREARDFDAIALSGFGRVIVEQGDEEALTVETDDNLMQYIETEVRNGTLHLDLTDNTNLKPSNSIVFYVSVIDLATLDSSGAGKFEIDTLETERFNVTLSGAGDITVDSLTATDLTVSVSGAGNVDLAGRVETQAVTLSGVGTYNAADLESQIATVSVSGAGAVGVWVLDTLDVTISGAGDVSYYGDPTVTKDVNGLGSLTSEGSK